jgi:hypothetical protein
VCADAFAIQTISEAENTPPECGVIGDADTNGMSAYMYANGQLMRYDTTPLMHTVGAAREAMFLHMHRHAYAAPPLSTTCSLADCICYV